MKKLSKRFVSSLMVICMSVSMISMAVELDVTNDAREVTQSFIDFVEPIYSGQADGYVVTDFNGLDVSSEFYAATEDYYSIGDWSSIHEYFANNIEVIRVDRSSSVLSSRLDIAKTQTADFTRNVNSVNLPGYRREVNYTLRGTIHYDPNTSLISSAPAPVMTFFSANVEATTYLIRAATGTIDSSKQYAAFSQTTHIYQLIIPSIDFGDITDTFKIYAN